MNVWFRQQAKRWVHRFMHPLGFDLPRRGIRTSMAGVVRHFAELGFRPATVVDVGAAYGTIELYEGFRDSRHVLVEPLCEYEPYLEQMTRRYGARYVLAAAGARSGRMVINVHRDLQGSSLLGEVEGIHADGLPREVPVVTLDELCAELGFSGPYLIKADVQGAELRVLDGARRIMGEAGAVILEVSLFHFMLDGPDLYDVVRYMKDRGFVVYDIFGGLVRPLDRALAQVDMVFVNERGEFRQNHAYATREQREGLTRRRTP